MTWIEELARMKKASGKTTKEISSKSGVPVGTLNKIFAGQTKEPQLETVKSIVYCLGYRLDDLYPQAEQTSPVSPTLEEQMEELLDTLSPGQAALLVALARRMLEPFEVRAGLKKTEEE